MSVPDALRERIRRQAEDRCGYCRSPQRYVLGQLEIDPIIPIARGSTDAEDNLWLACRLCNAYKWTQVYARDPVTQRRTRLHNPPRQKWARHFAWSSEGTRIVGRTACGRATAIALQLNNLIAVMVRREWVSAGWHPPM